MSPMPWLRSPRQYDRCRCGWRWGVEYVNGPRRVNEAEIIQQASLAVHGLGADARATSGYVVHAKLRQEGSECIDKGSLVPRPIHLTETHAPVLGCHDPESREGEQAQHVAKAEIGLSIALSSKGQNGIGTRFH